MLSVMLGGKYWHNSMKKKIVATLCIGLATSLAPAIGHAEPSDDIASSNEGIAPPINPMPSFYELKRMKAESSLDIGVAPPVNPFPRKSIES